jgi:hypothetical protein
MKMNRSYDEERCRRWQQENREAKDEQRMEGDAGGTEKRRCQREPKEQEEGSEAKRTTVAQGKSHQEKMRIILGYEPKEDGAQSLFRLYGIARIQRMKCEEKKRKKVERRKWKRESNRLNSCVSITRPVQH